MRRTNQNYFKRKVQVYKCTSVVFHLSFLVDRYYYNILRARPGGARYIKWVP